MKKLAVLGLFVAGALQALPLVNPADSVMYTNGICWHEGENTCCFPSCDYDCWEEMFSMRFGFSGDYVFNRHIEVRHGLVGNHPTATHPEGGVFSTVSLMTNAGTFCINFIDWIEAYAAFGVTRISVKASSSLSGDTTPIQGIFTFDPSTSYLVGAAAPILQNGSFLLGVQAQYFYTFPNASYTTNYADGTIAYYNSDRAKYIEYQGAIAMSYNFENELLSFVPFAGIQFSGVSWNLDSVNAIVVSGTTYAPPDAKEQQVVGWTIGTSMYLCNRGGVTAEARFANEKALNVSGQLVF